MTTPTLKTIAAPRSLYLAFQKVVGRTGARTPGWDSVTAKGFSKQLGTNLQRLSKELLTGRYRPEPYRVILIPKQKGERQLSVPTIRDRVVHEAVRAGLATYFEPLFLPSSFAYRSGRGVKAAHIYLKEMLNLKHHSWVIDADIKSFFDSVDHLVLLELLASTLSDGKLYRLLSRLIRAAVIDNNRRKPLKRGIAQGSPLSPLLANLYLHQLDVYMNQLENVHPATAYLRYADDFLVFCQTRKQATLIQKDLTGYLKTLKLSLSDKKTAVTKLQKGVPFLGLELKPKRNHLALYIPSERKEKLIGKLNQYLEANKNDVNLDILNKRLRGWCQGVAYADNAERVFTDIDRVVQAKVLKQTGSRFIGRKVVIETLFKAKSLVR